MTFTWRTYQTEVIEQVEQGGGKGLIALPAGAGKTAIAVEIVRRHEAQVIMVTAPVNTSYGWERHFEMFMPELPFHTINAKTQDAVLPLIQRGQPGVYMVGWEYGRGSYRYKKGPDGKRLMVKKGHSKVPVVETTIREALDWSKMPLDAAIIDESARMGNRKASQTKVVHTAKNAPLKLCLSATPAGNAIENIWSTLHFLWPESHKFFGPWTNAYLVKQVNDHAARKTGLVVYDYLGEKVPGRVAKSIPVYAKRTEEEVHGELPGVVPHLIEVDLTPAQRRIYTQFEQEALAWLDEYPVAAALPITKMIRMREAALAVPSVDEETGEVYFKPGAKSSKIEMLVDLITDLPVEDKVLVWTHSRKIIPAITAALGEGTTVVMGGQNKTTRTAALEAFTHGDSRFLVATIPALGEGWDGGQHVAATEVWLSHDENLMLNIQARGRLFRPGQGRVVNRHIIVARDTLETRQLGRLKTTENLLLEADMI